MTCDGLPQNHQCHFDTPDGFVVRVFPTSSSWCQRNGWFARLWGREGAEKGQVLPGNADWSSDHRGLKLCRKGDRIRQQQKPVPFQLQLLSILVLVDYIETLSLMGQPPPMFAWIWGRYMSLQLAGSVVSRRHCCPTPSKSLTLCALSFVRSQIWTLLGCSVERWPTCGNPTWQWEVHSEH